MEDIVRVRQTSESPLPYREVEARIRPPHEKGFSVPKTESNSVLPDHHALAFSVELTPDAPEVHRPKCHHEDSDPD
jgi:hypothetical protein